MPSPRCVTFTKDRVTIVVEVVGMLLEEFEMLKKILDILELYKPSFFKYFVENKQVQFC